MGNGCKCMRAEEDKNKIIIVECRDIIGQFNNYKSYGNFDLLLGKKVKKDDDLEIEGSFVEDKMKYPFQGKINKENITIEARISDLYNKKFLGKYDKDLERYVGEYSLVGNVKNLSGRFWARIIAKNFWLESDNPQLGQSNGNVDNNN